MTSLPPLGSTVYVVDDAGVVVGRVSPLRVGEIAAGARLAMGAMRTAAGGNPFPARWPVPDGWELWPGGSLEYGHSQLAVPPRVIPLSADDDAYEYGTTWDAVAVGGELELEWYLTATPAGRVVARPFLLSDVRPTGWAFDTGGTVYDMPRPGPPAIVLPDLSEPLVLTPEDVRAALGLREEFSDGYSFTIKYTGPYWDYASR